MVIFFNNKNLSMLIFVFLINALTKIFCSEKFLPRQTLPLRIAENF
ncbi:hypothetical protein APS_2622 [Acetobacter pasteurianus subsp. pasteurianus LMG 1262 = NBRC 106471]|nr:hypothetical protein APS_2622 [Acetobacter pasteurianus subsp. pasteurianus LMG 1262 = NBRC 106471]